MHSPQNHSIHISVVPWNPALPETNIAPQNERLDYYFPIGEAYFQGAFAVSFRKGRFLSVIRHLQRALGFTETHQQKDKIWSLNSVTLVFSTDVCSRLKKQLSQSETIVTKIVVDSLFRFFMGVTIPIRKKIWGCETIETCNSPPPKGPKFVGDWGGITQPNGISCVESLENQGQRKTWTTLGRILCATTTFWILLKKWFNRHNQLSSYSLVIEYTNIKNSVTTFRSPGLKT